jgi:hypothetical protein
MTQYERDQIIEALECCGQDDIDCCRECPIKERCLKEANVLERMALSLINELIEENDRLKELGTTKEVEKEIARRQTQAETDRKMKEAVKEVKAAMWDIICAEGVEVTNQNLDWLIERAIKVVVRRDEE